MDQRPKPKKVQWSSVLSFVIFILVVAGGPIFNALRQLTNGTVNLPSNVLPYLIIGFVLLSTVVSLVRGLANTRRSQNDTRLPTAEQSVPQRTNAPMPPFAGPSAPRQFPRSEPTPAPTTSVEPAPQSQVPPLGAPRFEPLISPRIIAASVIGIVILGAIGFVVLQSVP